MPDLIERARAVLRADIEAANAATPGPWRDSSTVTGVRYGALVADRPHPDRPRPDKGGWTYDPEYGGCLIGESLMAADRAYIARQSPDRVIRQAEAMLAILNGYREPQGLASDLVDALRVGGGGRKHLNAAALALARAIVGGDS